MVRPLTRARSKSRYERARLAAGALTTQVRAERRSRRLGSRSLPHTVAVPGSSTLQLRPDRANRKAGRDQEQATDVATVDQTRRVLEAAAITAAAIRDHCIPGDPPNPDKPMQLANRTLTPAWAPKSPRSSTTPAAQRVHHRALMTLPEIGHLVLWVGQTCSVDLPTH
ncbi:hypothetical protein ACFRCI_50015 [Streptomyces sp. NPDC056638]|uniref:hypothetical protein n=1 Tax=Streptomyces sp. NPDC056638 TaxID=3345887 RepID=UPI003677E9DD